MKVRGASALVIAGADRLGRAIALALAEAGANVTISYRRSAAAARMTLTALESLSGEGLARQADVLVPDDVDALLSAVVGRFGRLDILVANAGVFRPSPLDSVTEEDWDEMVAGNFETVRIPVERAAPLMKQSGRGSIVTIADVAAVHPWGDYVPYCVAKGCVVAFTIAMAKRLAPTIRVNTIAPGPILFPDGFPPAARKREIDKTLLKRRGAPADIAEAVLHLASNDYVTGTLLPIDGGRLIAP